MILNNPVYAQSSAPDPITNLAAVPGNGSVHLVWSAPDNNGSPITSYKVIQWVTGSDTFTTFPNLSNTASVTVTGLKNNVSYSFKVYAINSAGTSLDSNIVSVTPTASAPATDVPDAVTNLQATRGNGKVNLSWTTPNSNGSPIIGYTVTYWQVGTDAFKTKKIDGVATSTQITGLSNGVPYAFRINALNNIGTGPDSNVDSATPSESVTASAPNQVRGLVAVPSNGQVLLSWIEPSDNGSPITSYKVIANEKGSNTFTTYPNLGDSTKVTITGLRNDVTYEFKVVAINAIGQSKDSNKVSASPNTRVPIAITNLKATPGDGMVTLNWSVSSSVLDSISSYRVREYRPGVSTFVTHEILGKATTATIDGLTNGIPYGFRIVAVNSEGIGPDSSTVYATPMPKPDVSKTPSQVLNLKATPGDKQVTLTWNKPFDNGSPITGYNIIQFKTGSNTFTTIPKSDVSTSAVVTGLVNSVSYNFKVSAINANGEGLESTAVSVVPSAPQSNLQLPSWIKNNALLWAEGKISDKEYVQSIEYLINNKIIKIK
ncbi:MAG: fibronectin type III domain-containing protein [Crenarchaeota archaeon]|nr:MAG: fibronectin type III domain-containing protein [Thermoproteota archaeon]RDJ34332.1 MAG: fibronectin type III domain-containing protein [Thermoproteota archaeon]RDJ37204.1 MAG: fibronectin type III domain-containing protein [Thermoproteota archaeon]RDJ37916.1 MAG: fibronectin type III domain-containing protein [Thermoproteota archaeon]